MVFAEKKPQVLQLKYDIYHPGYTGLARGMEQEMVFRSGKKVPLSWYHGNQYSIRIIAYAGGRRYLDTVDRRRSAVSGHLTRLTNFPSYRTVDRWFRDRGIRISPTAGGPRYPDIADRRHKK